MNRAGQLHAEVVRIDLRAKLHFFHLVGVLVLFRLFVLLRLLVAELAVVDDAANRRRGVGRYFYQVNSERLRLANCFSQWQHSELLTIRAYDADFAGTDLSVDPDLWSTRPRGTRRKRAAQGALLWRMFMRI